MMIVLGKLNRNLSDYIQFLLKKKDFDWIKKGIISCEEMRNSGNYNYG